eukprot:2126432-Amphidinium_carterae.1
MVQKLATMTLSLLKHGLVVSVDLCVGSFNKTYAKEGMAVCKGSWCDIRMRVSLLQHRVRLDSAMSLMRVRCSH